MLLVGLTIDPAPMARRAGTILVLALSVVASIVLRRPRRVALAGDGRRLARGRTARASRSCSRSAAGLAAQGVPIVARILEERGLMRSEVGGVAIATGACVTTLALLASGVAIRGGDAAAFAELALVVAAGVAIVAVAAPLAARAACALSPRVAVAALLAIALAAGARRARSLLGTVLIGPLIVGIAVRNAGFSAVFLEARLGSIVRGVLLPVFLAVAALHTNLRELGMNALGPVLVLIAAVVVVKIVVAYAGARLAGFDRREARAMGALMQCGGVMTIAISLDVLHAGIVTPRTHALHDARRARDDAAGGTAARALRARVPAVSSSWGPGRPAAPPAARASRADR